MDKNKTSIERMLQRVLNDDQPGAKALLGDALVECMQIRQRCTNPDGRKLIEHVDKLETSLQQVNTNFKVLKGKSSHCLQEFEKHFRVFLSVLFSCFI